MSTYRFKTPTPQQQFGPLPEGDYLFTVTESDEPYTSRSGNLVLPLKLRIEPGGETVWANPWARTEESQTQDGRDGIAEFLVCVNRAPKEGKEPDWRRLVGVKGRCRLKIEIANQGNMAGKEVNKVAWFHAPKQVSPHGIDVPPPGPIKSAFDQARGQQKPTEPDDIPY